MTKSCLRLSEMELNHRLSPSHADSYTCTNNDALTVVVTLPNLENYLEIDIPGIDNLLPLSNTLFSEEDQHSSFTPTNL